MGRESEEYGWQETCQNKIWAKQGAFSPAFVFKVLHNPISLSMLLPKNEINFAV